MMSSAISERLRQKGIGSVFKSKGKGQSGNALREVLGLQTITSADQAILVHRASKVNV